MISLKFRLNESLDWMSYHYKLFEIKNRITITIKFKEKYKRQQKMK